MDEVIAIISSFNRGKKILPTINSLLKQTVKVDKIILIDDGSDASKKIPKLKKKNAEIIYLKKNVGVVWGRNLGLSLAGKYKYVLLIDDDIELAKDSLEKLLLAYKNKKDCVASMPVVYFQEARNKVWSAGSGVDLTTGRTIFYTEEPQTEYMEIPAATSVLLADMQVIKRVGWYDPIYYFCYEDVDFYYRLRLSGKIYCVKGARAYHDVSLKGPLTRVAMRSYHIARGRVIFLSRYSAYFPFNLIIVFIYFLYYQYLGFRYGMNYAGINFIKGFIDGIRVCLRNESKLNANTRYTPKLNIANLKNPAILQNFRVRL